MAALSSTVSSLASKGFPTSSFKSDGALSWTQAAFFSSAGVANADSRLPRAFHKNAARPAVQAVLDVPANRDTKGLSTTSNQASLSSSPPSYMSAEQRIFEMVVKEAAASQLGPRENLLADFRGNPEHDPELAESLLDEAYARCGEVCAEYAKTFYLGTKLMTPERQRAIWAIYVWCRRTDELVDGPNAAHITPDALDRWEKRLEDLFAGQPYDMLDATLSDTVATFPLSIQPFRDMIDGMRMDLRKSRYANFDELYLYCYNVAGTVGLMSVPVMGIEGLDGATSSTAAETVDVDGVYAAALALGIANQLTNILRDVGEDSRRGRIYLPQDELARFGLSDSDIFEGKVTERWREFMRFQITRARDYFQQAEIGVAHLSKQSRWPVFASLSLYRQILDSIEANDFDNFSKRAYVSKTKKFLSLPYAYLRALSPPPPLRTPSSKLFNFQ